MKTLSTLLALCLLFSFTLLHAQAPAILWQKSLGGSAVDGAQSLSMPSATADIKQTTDGGYILAGYSRSTDGDVTGNHGGADFWVAKLNGSGNLVWQKSYGGTSDDFGTSVCTTSDGGYIVAGYTVSNDGDVSGNHAAGFYLADYWIIKLDATGSLQWQKCLGGSNMDQAYSIQQTTDGGYIVAGWSNSINGDVAGHHSDACFWGTDYWIVKLNSSGTISWQKCVGGPCDDFAFAVQQTSDGGYVVAGYSQSIDGDVSGHSYCPPNDQYTPKEYYCNPDFWIVKVDATGTIQWQKSMGSANPDNAYSITQTSDRGYAIAGASPFYHPIMTDIYVLKLDSNGNTSWDQILGGIAADAGYCIKQLNDGRYVIAGSTASTDGDATGNHGSNDYWVIALDAKGNKQWQKTLGGTASDMGSSILQTSDGRLVVAGFSSSNDGDVSGNHGSGDYWVVKLQKEDSAIITLPLPPAGLCTSQSLNIGYSVIYNLNTGNIFTAQLSDANGSFATPTVIGSVASATSGSIAATIPSNTPLGTHYRVRVVSSSPVLTGYDNQSDLLMSSAAPSVTDATVTASGSTTICSPETVTLSVASSGFKYQWKKNDINISGATQQSLIVALTGNYACEVSNGCGIITSNSIAVTLSFIAPTSIQAAITAGGATTFCTGGSVVLSVATPGLIYVWKKNGGTITGATNQSYTVSATGNYTCKVNNSCGNITSNNIYVSAQTTVTTAQATISANGSTTLCDGQTVQLSAPLTPFTYHWKKDGLNISGATSNYYVASASGNYTCAVSNTCGMLISNSISVTVNTPVTLSQATISASGSVTVCDGKKVKLTVATAELTYQWKKNGTNITGATRQSYSASSSGSYTCSVSNSCGGIISNSISVTVNQKPASTVTSGPCSGGTVTLTDVANPNTGITYKWIKNGAQINSATNSTYVASQNGSYTCQVTITATGCKSTSAAVNVTINCKLAQPQESVSVYPNPSSDYFIVKTSSPDQSCVIYIYDLTGRLVESHQTNGDQTKVGETLVNGVYFLKVALNNETMQVIKLVKNF